VPKSRRVPVPPPPVEEEPLFSPDEMDKFVHSSLKYGIFYKLLGEADRFLDVDLSGHVYRDRGCRYVHERSTTFELTGDAYTWITKDHGDPSEQEAEYINKLIVEAQETIAEHVVDINKAIYQQLEREYEYQTSGEGAKESLRANDYEFTEEGQREDKTGIRYDDLSDEAKERALSWWSESFSGDDSWSESVIEDWKEHRLPEMGFGENAEIAFSGFWSQGDGASFTCTSFDLRKYAEYLTLGKAKDIGL